MTIEAAALVPPRAERGKVHDAFGIGDFSCVAALDASRQLQRERVMLKGNVDLRGTSGSLMVPPGEELLRLQGGPYNGQMGVFYPRQREAWVIGDYFYVRRANGIAEWWYDEYA